MNCGVNRTRQVSKINASGTVSASDVVNWISVPALRSKLGQRLF